jgi:hypothetical protein
MSDLHASSEGTQSGGHTNAEGAIGVALDAKNARQAMPSQNIQHASPGNQGGTVYQYEAVFDPGAVAENETLGEEAGERDTLPEPRLAGAVPDPGCGDPGQPVNWAGVAPVKHPFPKDTISVGLSPSEAAIPFG